MSHSIVLYDGVCGLCNGVVRFLLKHDKQDRLRYASLQSDFAHQLLGRHGENSDDLDTVWVVVNPEQLDERLLNRSDAILQLGKELGGIWQLGSWGRILPGFLRDWLYTLIARNRYRVFGRYDTCMLPNPKYRNKFLDW
ncbi:MAG: thiol-disulfide oxidoreductase DCC family protein [Pyrinomonadaceae bacterium]